MNDVRNEFESQDQSQKNTRELVRVAEMAKDEKMQQKDELTIDRLFNENDKETVENVKLGDW